MRSKEDSDELFSMAANDPSLWHEQARWLKTAAQMHFDQIVSIRARDMPAWERSDAMMPHFQAFMMLMSFSFENLIKAILVSRNPGRAVTNKKAKLLLNLDLWKNKNGHEIATIIPDDILLSAEEKDLLERLQIFGVWAGRYPTATNSDTFHSSQDKGLQATDSALIDNLFFRLARYILNND